MESTKFNIVLALSIVLAAILFSVSGPLLKIVFSIASLISVIITSKLNRGYKSLRAIIIIVLLSGMLIMIPMFFYQELLKNQVKYLLIYMLFALVQFLVWFIIYNVYELHNEVEELRKKIFKREGRGSKRLILSNDEYKVRKDFVINGSKRRGETAYELEILVVKVANDMLFKSLFDTVGEALIETVRENYDIIAKKKEDTYIVLLQNMDEDKQSIVVNRFFRKLELDVINAKDYIQIYKNEIRGNSYGR